MQTAYQSLTKKSRYFNIDVYEKILADKFNLYCFERGFFIWDGVGVEGDG